MIPAFIIAGLLFGGIIIFHIFGFRVNSYQKKRNPEFTTSGIGPLEGSLLGLLSLLLAFTFNKAASNYDTRKALLVQESNDIGTALLRCDLYSDSIRNGFRNDFKEYIARIEYYKSGTDENKIQENLRNAGAISKKIWLRAAIISQESAVENRSIQMIPAVNNMIDTLGKREASRIATVPESIIWLLLLLALIGSFIVGYASTAKKINWIVIFLYSLMTVMTVYLILDLDRPRRGLISTNITHKNMEKLLESFSESPNLK
jgi:hypothetical protein